MYAVIEDSGKQFRVAKGDVVNVDLRELAEGQDTIEFAQVLFVSGEGEAAAKVGTPTVAGAKVKAKVLGVIQAEKLDVWHVRRRKNRSRKKTGHRQKYLQVSVEEITA
jgi:large subunit ribosomal protein L21